VSELRQVMEVLQSLDWVGRLSEQNDLGQSDCSTY
jgi:membrane protein